MRGKAGKDGYACRKKGVNVSTSSRPSPAATVALEDEAQKLGVNTRAASTNPGRLCHWQVPGKQQRVKADVIRAMEPAKAGAAHIARAAEEPAATGSGEWIAVARPAMQPCCRAAGRGQKRAGKSGGVATPSAAQLCETNAPAARRTRRRAEERGGGERGGQPRQKAKRSDDESRR